MARSTRVQVKVVGLERIARNMAQLTDEIRDRVSAAIKDEAEQVADIARQACPVKTGSLKRSIRVEAGELGLTAEIVAGGREAPHAHLVEFGTRRAPEHPYMYPALEQRKEAIVAAVDRAIGDAIP